jgi:hypothetical protein
MKRAPKCSPEVQERAVRMVFDAKDRSPSQWALQAHLPHQHQHR